MNFFSEGIRFMHMNSLTLFQLFKKFKICVQFNLIS
jgi:hypothetical protein